ncbi:MAG: TerC family protein [Chloroflexi bacterium]|nr:TerC family protein [Chloroflexota bacterium]
MANIWIWIIFNLFVILMLALDLGIFHRKSKEIEVREALLWSAFWVALSLAFNVGIYFWQGPEKALEFLAGYLIEKSLSVDNIFVFLLIFSYFGVPPRYQHRVLFYGILGALVMRGIFIAAGVTLVEKFHWTIYVLGAFLVYTGIRMAIEKDKEIHPEKNPVIRAFQWILPVTPEYEGSKFFVKRAGKYLATPLFVVLLVVDTADVMFAVDSIPAILAVTLDPFIVYTSNVFAILGLRALYFALAGIMRLFHYLHYGLSLILVFIGVKMLIAEFYKVPIGVALGVIAAVLTASVVASLIWPQEKEETPTPSMHGRHTVVQVSSGQGE